MYTVKIIKNIAILDSTTSNDKKSILHTEPHFDKCKAAAKAKRLINFTPSGRVTTSKDYHGAYDKKTTKSKPKKLSVSKLITTMAELNIDADALEPLKTGTVFDKFMSNEGGFLARNKCNGCRSPRCW